MRLQRLRSWLLVLAGAVVVAGLVALGVGSWDGSATTPRLGPAVHVSPAAVTAPTVGTTPTPPVDTDTHDTDGASAIDPAGPPAAGPDDADEPDETPDADLDGPTDGGND